MIYLAVDPGTTTGFAYYYHDEDGAPDFPIADQLPAYEFCKMAHDMTLEWSGEITFIVEKFTISERTLKVTKGGSYDALEVIGVVRYISKLLCDQDIIMQTPSSVMKLITNEWLRNREWYETGKEHANDALRHLAVGLAKRGIIKLAQ